ncbi:putative oxidoreductase GLYR1, partial [Aphis craccivora]
MTTDERYEGQDEGLSAVAGTAWIELGCLKPYFQFKDTLTYSHKGQAFKDACKAIEEYILENNSNEGMRNGLSDAESRFENLVETETPIFQPPEKTKKTSNARNASVSKSPVKAKKRPSKPVGSTSNGPKKDKPKKPRLNLKVGQSSSIPEVLSNVGLLNNHSSPIIRKNNTLLDRPEVVMPEVEQLDISTISKSLQNKEISASPLTFGFIGLGNMGSGIVKNLLESGHKVILWNRTPNKCEKFEAFGAIVALTPSDVVGGADITFSCVSDPQVAKDMVFGNCGVLPEITKDKGFVEMTGIDPDTSQDICEAILNRGGRYLEAMIQGSKKDAEEGNLICMAAGDKSLFDDCKSSFDAISASATHIGDVGVASKLNLILHSIKAVSLAGLAEGMALADRASIPQNKVLEYLQKTSLNCPLLIEKGKAMMENNFQTNQALKHIQKDLNLSLNWSDVLEQPCPVMANVNEVFKHAKRLGYSDHDTSAKKKNLITILLMIDNIILCGQLCNKLVK